MGKRFVIKSISIRKDVAKELEVKAGKANRSVSNFIETILLREFKMSK